MFEVDYSNKVISFLKKIDRVLHERIVYKIESLRENPNPSESKLLEGYSKIRLFRIRVGEYRILYEIDYENNMIGIIKIDKRSRVYN